MLHEGEVAGGGEGEEPAFALTLFLCQLTCYGECREGKPFDCSGIIDEEAEALLVLEVVLSEVRLSSLSSRLTSRSRSFSSAGSWAPLSLKPS